MAANRDERYLTIILDSLRVCATYKPKFGQGRGNGLTLQAFQELYQADPFYRWFGLDNPLMYAAHKAAGGMTSVYRQIGTGCEKVFRQILRDTLGLAANDAVWSYKTRTSEDKTRTLTLDGRIPLERITNKDTKRRVYDWMMAAAKKIGVNPKIARSLTGIVFGVRELPSRGVSV
jgi:hypothetical protein